MARQKSNWRKRINSRWLRWKFWRTAFKIIPINHAFSFSMSYISVCSIARKTLCDKQTLETADFTAEQSEHILGPASISDKVRSDRPPSTSATFMRRAIIVPDCAVLGHVQAVVRSADCAMLSPTAGRRPPNWNFAKPKRLKTRTIDEGQVTLLRGGHYYHFMAELLPLLNYLDNEHSKGTSLTVLVPADAPAFHREICTAVSRAYPDLEFVPLRTDERAEIREYLWLYHACDNDEWLPVAPPEMERFSKLLRRHYRLPPPNGGLRIFFSRGSAKLRRLLNEPDLEAIAAPRGFERFEAHSNNHAEQVRYFSNADVIIAVHGAGLTNLMFARPGATVIEIFPENYVKSTYLWVAARLRLKYRALIGDPGDYHLAFTFDVARFATVLDEVLDSNSMSGSTP